MEVDGPDGGCGVGTQFFARGCYASLVFGPVEGADIDCCAFSGEEESGLETDALGSAFWSWRLVDARYEMYIERLQ